VSVGAAFSSFGENQLRQRRTVPRRLVCSHESAAALSFRFFSAATVILCRARLCVESISFGYAIRRQCQRDEMVVSGVWCLRWLKMGKGERTAGLYGWGCVYSFPCHSTGGGGAVNARCAWVWDGSGGSGLLPSRTNASPLVLFVQRAGSGSGARSHPTRCRTLHASIQIHPSTLCRSRSTGPNEPTRRRDTECPELTDDITTTPTKSEPDTAYTSGPVARFCRSFPGEGVRATPEGRAAQ
jgi:hypothetical protein